jgi:hypothetical protein
VVQFVSQVSLIKLQLLQWNCHLTIANSILRKFLINSHDFLNIDQVT